VSKFIEAALNNQNITIYGSGAQTRTFCYIEDNIEATTKIFENSLYVNEVINIGSSKELSIVELAEKVISITDSSSSIVHLEALIEGDMTRRQPDNSKMLQVLNRNLLSIEGGISKILDIKYSLISK
jgi:UDP-glucose 4-epimerase